MAPPNRAANFAAGKVGYEYVEQHQVHGLLLQQPQSLGSIVSLVGW